MAPPYAVFTCRPTMRRSVPLMAGSSASMSSRRCSESSGDDANRFGPSSVIRQIAISTAMSPSP